MCHALVDSLISLKTIYLQHKRVPCTVPRSPTLSSTCPLSLSLLSIKSTYGTTPSQNQRPSPLSSPSLRTPSFVLMPSPLTCRAAMAALSSAPAIALLASSFAQPSPSEPACEQQRGSAPPQVRPGQKLTLPREIVLPTARKASQCLSRPYLQSYSLLRLYLLFFFSSFLLFFFSSFLLDHFITNNPIRCFLISPYFASVSRRLLLNPT